MSVVIGVSDLKSVEKGGKIYESYVVSLARPNQNGLGYGYTEQFNIPKSAFDELGIKEVKSILNKELVPYYVRRTTFKDGKKVDYYFIEKVGLK